MDDFPHYLSHFLAFKKKSKVTRHVASLSDADIVHLILLNVEHVCIPMNILNLRSEM